MSSLSLLWWLLTAFCDKLRRMLVIETVEEAIPSPFPCTQGISATRVALGDAYLELFAATRRGDEAALTTARTAVATATNNLTPEDLELQARIEANYERTWNDYVTYGR